MGVTSEDIERVKLKYIEIKGCLSEKGRRLWAAVEAKSYGRGGIVLLCKATGVSNATIHKGIRELSSNDEQSDRVRRKGGGRKSIAQKQPGLINALESMVEPFSKGDPENPLRWTSKSTRKLAASLNENNYKVSHTSVGVLLHQLGYSLQANKKTLENSSHEDRNEQFAFINQSVKELQKKGQPTISVDTKKKENIGNFKNNGREYSKKGKPLEVKGHDFIDKKLGKVVPYGIYDIGKNEGWVSVGISSDTAEFAVNSIRTWWFTDGVKKYPSATELLITADCGGSNGYRTRLWKVELQKLSDELNLEIKVRHFPPGTSKWNKIEHRLFSYISKNWRGKPLLTRETVVNLIGNTTTTTGLTVAAVLDENNYQTGIKITDEEMLKLNKIGEDFHPEWNYSIRPSTDKIV